MKLTLEHSNNSQQEKFYVVSAEGYEYAVTKNKNSKGSKWVVSSELGPKLFTSISLEKCFNFIQNGGN